MDGMGNSLKIKDFDETLQAVLKRLEWIEACLYSALGFKANPEMQDKDGNIDKKIKFLEDDLRGNGKMGLKTKIMILWFALPILTSIIGFLLGMIIKGYFK